MPRKILPIIDKKSLLFFLFLIAIFFVRLLSTKEVLPENKKVIIKTTVTSEPIFYERQQYLKITNLKVYLPKNPQINYGDNIEIRGTVSNGKLLDPTLIKITKTKNPIFINRQKVIAFFQQNLSEPHASLVAGVTLGSKASIPETFWGNLKATGTAHVVVASGMNVTLVAGFAVSVLINFFDRRKTVVISIILIWLYAILSGFDAPIIRASVMGTIAFSAIVLGRASDAKRALILSALGMLIIKPIWITDLGFILSFVATGSLMLFEKKISRLLKFVPNLFREGLSTSLSAQIGVAPILYYYFGSFNLFSPIINALVLWTIAPITILGMISAILSFILLPLGKLTLYLSYPLTLWFVGIIELFS